MPAWNPLHGDIPVATQRRGGAVPGGSDDNGGQSIIGALTDPVPNESKGAPTVLSGLVLLSAGVIILIHLAGVRTHFTVSAGG